jgi:chromosome segregation ATPase
MGILAWSSCLEGMRMPESPNATEAIRERLTALLADWGAEMSLLLRELDALRTERGEHDAELAGQSAKIRQLEDRAKGQNELIETLKAEAAEAKAFRDEVRDRDLEIEKLKSEIESKQELVRALRRDTAKTDSTRAGLKQKDRELAELKVSLKASEDRLATVERELDSINERSASEVADGHAELEAVRAELEARKTMIKSLRGDSDRVAALEAQLEDKREVIAKFEDSINRHVATIADLRRSSDGWKKKYYSRRGHDSDSTSSALPTFTSTDVAEMQQLEYEEESEHTASIDMRQPLREARRKMAEGSES